MIRALNRILEETVNAALDAQRAELQAAMDRTEAELSAGWSERLRNETASYRRKRDFWRTAAVAGWAAAAVSAAVVAVRR